MECRDPDQISIPDQIDMETQVLDLSGINLQILSREVFARHGLLNLQKLHLSSCKIGQIDPTAFRGLTNLVELNLSGNLLHQCQLLPSQVSYSKIKTLFLVLF